MTSMPAPGATLSHYRLVEKVGEGGMGVVYRAHDTRLDRDVAVKVLAPRLTADPELRRRFLREARAAAAVSHPGIATIHEIDESGGTVFIVMELVEGPTLRSLLRGGPLPPRDALRLGAEVASALARAHRAHVIHRDFKPDNVVVGPDGRAKVLDFGLAKILDVQADSGPDPSTLRTAARTPTEAGSVMGTTRGRRRPGPLGDRVGLRRPRGRRRQLTGRRRST
jgi:serine/threonine protein kinase